MSTGYRARLVRYLQSKVATVIDVVILHCWWFEIMITTERLFEWRSVPGSYADSIIQAFGSIIVVSCVCLGVAH